LAASVDIMFCDESNLYGLFEILTS